MEVTTIGLDIAKNVFQLHGIDAARRLLFASNFGAAKFWRFSRHYRHCWSAWRRAPPPIIGRVSS